MKRQIIFMLILALWISCAWGAYSQEWKIPKIKHAPEIDGAITDDEWSGAFRTAEMLQTSPGNNTEPTEKTEIFMASDEENIYIGARCYYQNIDTMRLHHCSRDEMDDVDRIHIYLDSFHTRDKAYFFIVNPFGEQGDGIITGYHQMDFSNDLYFQSRGKTYDWGYTVEVAIPFNSIKYASGELVSWGVLIRRYMPEKSEEVSSMVFNRGEVNYYKNFNEAVFTGVPSRGNLILIPGVTGVTSTREELMGGGKQKEDDLSGEVNLIYEPTSQMTLKATYNPDYSTVESDLFQVDVNNKYPLYFEEKRPFFLEETNPFNGPINIYHTRAIVNPLWGAKISYNRGANAFFALAAIDEDAPGERFDASGEEDALWGFSSYKYNFGADGDMRGAVSMRSFDGRINGVASLEANYRFENGFHTHHQAVWSQTETEDGVVSSPAYYSEMTFDDDVWHFELNTMAVGPDFRADMGYIPETGFHRYYSVNRMVARPGRDDIFFKFADISMSGYIKTDWDHSRRLESVFEPYITFGFDRNLRARVSAEYKNEYFNGSYYRQRFNGFWVQSNTFRWIGGSLFYGMGKQLWYDPAAPEICPFTHLEGDFSIRPNRMFQTFGRVVSSHMEEKYRADIFGLGMKVQFTAAFWIRLEYQRMKVDMDDPSMPDRVEYYLYPLFVYQPNSLISLSTGYRYGHGETSLPILTLEESRTKSWFMKLSYTLDLI
jgi:hypothetical protein